MCHKTRMNRAVGRCSARMRQVPAKCFFFHSILESSGRDNRLYKEAKPPRPRTGRGQSFVLLAPLSHLLSASPALLCMRRWICLALLSCPVLPCPALPCPFFSLFSLLPPTRQHLTPRQHCPVARPTSNLCICAPRPPQAGAQTQHRHLLTLHRGASNNNHQPFLQRSSLRSTPSQLRKQGSWQADKSRVAVGLQFFGKG